MRILTVFLYFLLSVVHLHAEETLFKSLASSYLNNPQLNSQREKTKAVDETLIQAYSNFKPTISATLSKGDYQYKNSFVADHELNTVACLTEIMAGVQFK